MPRRRTSRRSRSICRSGAAAYALYSLNRSLIAYVLSLAFTIVYGYWAAKDATAGKFLLPLLDILQSIPVLGFLPGVLLAIDALFPTNNLGLELSCILMIFTSQVWNMTFSFYHSLMSIPQEQREVASITASPGSSGSAGWNCRSPRSGSCGTA